MALNRSMTAGDTTGRHRGAPAYDGATTTNGQGRQGVLGDFGAGAATLEVTGLRKVFGDVVALAALDLQVQPGSILGLVGPNGAGKTTAIRCIAGLVHPDSGSVLITSARGRPDPRPIGLATQEIELYPGLSARTNLEFFGRLYGTPDAERAVDALSAEFGLGPMLDAPVMSLSTGQQRLVHVAAALVHGPGLLILDEPTAALDVGARAALLEALDLRRKSGTAILFSSHYLKEVEELCDDVVILNQGRVIASGPTHALIQREGGARVEVTVDGCVTVFEGTDVGAAVTRAGTGGRTIESVRVIPPSLEAVFLSLAGLGAAEVEAP